MAEVKKNISIDNARIGYRNFSGNEGKYNPKGNRNFCVFLDDDLAHVLEKDGWNVRWLAPQDPEDDKQAYLQVKVSYKKFPPKIVLITGTKKILQEAEVGILDWADISSVDLILRPYNWDVGGKHGVKAYLKAMYITIVEDEFEAKYRDVPTSGQASFQDDDEAF